MTATVAVGCFLLLLNILIFAGIYYQRKKPLKKAKTNSGLQDDKHYNNANTEKETRNLNLLKTSYEKSCCKGKIVFEEKQNRFKNSFTIAHILLENSVFACPKNSLGILKIKVNSDNTDMFNRTSFH